MQGHSRLAVSSYLGSTLAVCRLEHRRGPVRAVASARALGLESDRDADRGSVPVQAVVSAAECTGSAAL